MHRHQELKNEKILLDGNIQSQNSFALSEVGSLYFGPNPSPEAQRLLEQAKELIRENDRIQEAKEAILRDEAELRSKKVFLDSENSSRNGFQPNAELLRLMNETTALSDEGKQIDRRKAQLELYYKELKRRKEFLQKAIKMYEDSEMGQDSTFISRISSVTENL